MNQTECPRQDEIAAYILGTVDDRSQAAIDEHLSDCPHCQAVADELESSVSDPLMDLLHGPAPADDFSSEHECRQALSKAKRIGAAESLSSETSRDADTQDEFSLPYSLGKYQLVERIGGHMGVVYKALQTTLDRDVAVKLLPEKTLADQQAITRFQQEMKVVGRLDHPNIVRAYDAREIDGKHVFVMEWVKGRSLSNLLRSRGPMPTADACEVVRQAAVGLQYVHEKGLVHRDIKPSNLMLTPQGEVKILDLGLARFRAGQADARELTAAGHVVGTPGYMAPEQIADSSVVDTRADVYGLGCTLYKLLTGRAPYDDPKRRRSASDVMLAHQCEPVPSIKKSQPDVPDALVKIIERMLAKSPADRYETPGQVATALEPFASGCDLPAFVESWERRQRSGDKSVLTNATTGQPTSWFWKLVATAAVMALVIVGGKMGLERLNDYRGRGGENTLARQMQEADRTPRQLDPLPLVSDEQNAPEPKPEAPEVSNATAPVQPASETTADRQDEPKPSERQPPVQADNPPPETPAPTRDWLVSTRNERAAFVVGVEVDHADRVYRGPPAGPDGKGEVMRVKVESSKSGYLYLIYQTADGRIKCLFPNKVQPDNKIAAGKEIEIPHPDADFRLRVGPPYGKELLKAVVTLVPLEPEKFGVDSLTAADLTPLRPAPLKNVFVELKEEPVNWAEHQVEITTMPGKPASESPLPSGEGQGEGNERNENE